MSSHALEQTIEPSPNKKLPQKSNNGRGTSAPVAIRGCAKDAFKFIDLFAGIGGIRLAFEQAGAKCIFSSEWDVNAQKTYEANFFEKPHGDITKIEPKAIPDFDILTGGFPCQPFSMIGRREDNSSTAINGTEPTPTFVFEATANPELAQLLALDAKKPTFLKKMLDSIVGVVDRGKQTLNYQIFLPLSTPSVSQSY